jgi:hypothetical protein
LFKDVVMATGMAEISSWPASLPSWWAIFGPDSTADTGASGEDEGPRHDTTRINETRPGTAATMALCPVDESANELRWCYSMASL